MTAGDELDVLVAMNPAALKVNLADVKPHGLLILDSGAFSARNLAKAGYGSDPRTDGSLEACRVLAVHMSQMTHDALQDARPPKQGAPACKTLQAPALLLRMYGARP